MTEPILSRLLEALDTLVLAIDEDGTYQNIGGSPNWVQELYPEAAGRGAGLRPGEMFPFLENFLIDAETFWRTQTDGRLKSGLWYETDPGGVECLLEATAVSLAGSRILIIEQLEAEGESSQRLLQTGREENLDHQRDIQEHRRLAGELKASKEAAEEASRIKSEFLANISHELRTPLNAIVGFSEMLQDETFGSLNEKQLQYVGNVLFGGRQLLGLINEILDLSKIESGKAELQLRPVDLDLEVMEALVTFETQADQQEIELSWDIPEGLAQIQTDAGRLRQVLTNLVSNSLKFTEKGAVTVRVEADGETRNPIRIDVIDTGIGIPEEQLEKIFEAFRQADGSSTRQYEGTGLGLTISRSLCDLLGYRLAVASEVGRGSTFSIQLEPETQEARLPADGTLTGAGS